jgi:hypothetical protein
MSTRRKFHFPQFDTDLLLAWAILAFIAFLGIAAVGFYAGTASRALLQ